jgi:ribosomal protein S18 acetylase RimI-like enzyme
MFEKATPADAAALTAVQKRTFDDDARRFSGQPSGGPPGYDSERWQLTMMIRATAYYKIVDGDQIIGGIIVFDMGGGHFVLGRIWIDPAYQDRGIGKQAIQFIEQAHPQAKKWTLDTPAWAVRNHHFYEKAGYVKTREADGMLFYEKEM